MLSSQVSYFRMPVASSKWQVLPLISTVPCAIAPVMRSKSVLVGIPAIDHLAVGIIADPLAAIGFLVRVP